MKVRREISGLHLFDRKSGTHILFDEVKVAEEQRHSSPRTVSIALTNVCDLKCHFCYAPKNRQTLDFEVLKSICRQLDGLGVLEITLGGGEPTLYPEFAELCTWVWNNTNLGLSFTTHGHHLTDSLIERIANKISSIRFSIDGIEPRYSSIRGRKLADVLDRMEAVRGKIPFGINCVASRGETGQLESVIELSKGTGAENVLIIPEHTNGAFTLTEKDWRHIDQVIQTNRQSIELLVTYEAGNHLHANTLDVGSPGEYLFAHIAADLRLKKTSFESGGILIEDPILMDSYFNRLNSN